MGGEPEGIPPQSADPGRGQPGCVGFFCCPCVIPWHMKQLISTIESQPSIEQVRADLREINCCQVPSVRGSEWDCLLCCKYRGARGYPFGTGTFMSEPGVWKKNNTA